MPVVKVKHFFVSRSPRALNQEDMDNVSTSVNAFLATLDPEDVLDIRGEFAPGGKDAIRSTYVSMVAYLE